MTEFTALVVGVLSFWRGHVARTEAAKMSSEVVAWLRVMDGKIEALHRKGGRPI